jgi:tape measure domain-containing protein
MANKVGELYAVLSLDDGEFNRKIDETEKRFGGLRTTVTKVGAVIGGAFVASKAKDGLVAITKAGFDFNSSIEQTTISLSTMLGSQEKANDLIRDMTVLAAETPFEFPELANATKKLVAFGFGVEDVIPTMTRLGDLSSGLGISVSELSDIYGKARVQGRLFMEDINQLTGRGIPVIEEFARMFGVTEAEVRDLVTQGKIGFPELERAIAAMTDEGGKFGGLMEAQSKSFAGQISTLQDGFAELAGKLTEPIFTWVAEKFLPTLNRVVGSIVDRLSAGRGPVEFFARIWERAKPVLEGSGLSLNAIGQAMNMLNPIFGIFKEMWPALLPPLEQVARLLLELAAQVIPLMASAWEMFIGIAAPIIHSFLDLVAEVFPMILAIIEEVMQALIPLVSGVLEAIKGFWDRHGEAIIGAVEKLFSYLKPFIDGALRAIKGIISTVLGIITGDWSKAWDGIKTIVVGIWDAIKSLAMAFFDFMGSIFRAIGDTIKTLWSNAWNAIWNFVRSLWEDHIRPFFAALPERIYDALAALGSWMAKPFQEAWDYVSGALSWLWQGDDGNGGIKGWFKALPGKIVDAAGDLGKALYDWVCSAWDKVKEAVNWLVGKITGGLSAIKNFFTGGGGDDDGKGAPAGDLGMSLAEYLKQREGDIMSWGLGTPAAGVGFRGLRPQTNKMWSYVKGRFPSAYAQPDLSPRPYASDHPAGKALDITGPMRQVADYLAANMKTLGVKYIIYAGQINHGNGWNKYTPPKSLLARAGFATAYHYDHVHVSMFKRGGIIPGSGPVPIIGHGGERVLTEKQTGLFERLIAALEGSKSAGGPVVVKSINVQGPNAAAQAQAISNALGALA